ncbi:Protein O-GlcNAcase [Exaiptasia diaphana]|nr:Protein O-GlcNAcase [Exaiptasia diaphana]
MTVAVSLLGPKVISKVITPHSIQVLSNVLKRKPVIWDNIHANDYDQRRMFLGPYHGRPTQLYNSVGGVLTNPNCEFESNFVAIHTLGTWVKCAKGETPAEEPMSLDVESEKSTDKMDEDTEIPEKDAVESDKTEKSEPKENGDYPMETDSSTSLVPPPQRITEWKDRASKFHDLCQTVSEMFVRFSETPNRALLYDMYPYIWDVKESVLLLDTFINWLNSKSRLRKQRPNFFPVDPEPWVFRGGLCGELQTAKQNSRNKRGSSSPVEPQKEAKVTEEALMDVSDLKKPPSSPVTSEDLLLLVDLFYLPYSHGVKAKQILSEFKWLKNNAIKEESDEFKELTEDEQTAKWIVHNQNELLVIQKEFLFVGPYINICPEHVFVVEDSYGLCGYAVSTSDSKHFYELYKKDWLPKVCEKYSKPQGNSEEWTYADHIADSFYSPRIFLPDELYSKQSAHVRIDVLPRAQDHFLMKRLMTCVLSALKAEGCNGVYSEVCLNNRDAIESYCRLGFYEIQLKDPLPEDTIYYGRVF